MADEVACLLFTTSSTSNPVGALESGTGGREDLPPHPDRRLSVVVKGKPKSSSRFLFLPLTLGSGVTNRPPKPVLGRSVASRRHWPLSPADQVPASSVCLSNKGITEKNLDLLPRRLAPETSQRCQLFPSFICAQHRGVQLPPRVD